MLEYGDFICSELCLLNYFRDLISSKVGEMHISH